MNRNLTFAKDRLIDHFLLAVITAISETVVCRAATSWFPGQPYTVSVVIAMTVLTAMRWGFPAAAVAAVGGIAFCAASGASASQFAVYAIGNIGALAAMMPLSLWGKEAVRRDVFKTLVTVTAAYLGAECGRWLVSLSCGGQPADIIRFLTTDALSLVFGAVILLIARKSDGLFEDQKTYLFRLQKEKEAKKDDTPYDTE